MRGWGVLFELSCPFGFRSVDCFGCGWFIVFWVCVIVLRFCFFGVWDFWAGCIV